MLAPRDLWSRAPELLWVSLQLLALAVVIPPAVAYAALYLHHSSYGEQAPERRLDELKTATIVAYLSTIYFAFLWLLSAITAWVLTACLPNDFRRGIRHSLGCLIFGISLFLSWQLFAGAIEDALMNTSSLQKTALLPVRVLGWFGIHPRREQLRLGRAMERDDAIYNVYHLMCTSVRGRSNVDCTARYVWHFVKALPSHPLWANLAREIAATVGGNRPR